MFKSPRARLVTLKLVVVVVLVLVVREVVTMAVVDFLVIALLGLIRSGFLSVFCKTVERLPELRFALVESVLRLCLIYFNATVAQGPAPVAA